MEKAFAYICASAETAPRILKRYCRKVYELGYVPICPALNDAQYLALSNSDELRDLHSIALQKPGSLPDAGGLRQGDQPRYVGGDWFCREAAPDLYDP